MNLCTVFMIGCAYIVPSYQIDHYIPPKLVIGSNDTFIGCAAWPMNKQAECETITALEDVSPSIGDMVRKTVGGVMPLPNGKAVDCKSPRSKTGYSNSIIIGFNSGVNINFGNCIIIVGKYSGNRLIDGENVILIGDNSDTPTAYISNYINIQNVFCARIVHDRYVEEPCPKR